MSKAPKTAPAPLTKPLEIGTKRRCDYNGVVYTVKNGKHRFCSDECRSKYHRQGAAILMLRDVLPEALEQAAVGIEARLFLALDQPTQNRYRALHPRRAKMLEQFVESQQLAS